MSAQIKQLKRKLGAQRVIGNEAWVADRVIGDEEIGSMNVRGQWGVDDELAGLSTGRGQERGSNTSVDVPTRTYSAMTRQSGSKSWIISASHADMAMEFVLTYAPVPHPLPRLTM